jgi:hypothetical protein
MYHGYHFIERRSLAGSYTQSPAFVRFLGKTTALYHLFCRVKARIIVEYRKARACFCGRFPRRGPLPAEQSKYLFASAQKYGFVRCNKR